MYSSFEPLFEKLAKSTFRSKFRLNYQDRLYAEMKGQTVIKEQASDLISKRLAPATPKNDGSQTPYKGHPVFTAQHATGCCCRSCLLKWHNIPKGRELTETEQQYVVSVLLAWIEKDLQKTPKKKFIKKGETLDLF